RLTMNLYSHVDLEDQSAAISKLPGIAEEGSVVFDVTVVG
ncbi:unnamed protein product, partial [marine sediment metagenome]